MDASTLDESLGHLVSLLESLGGTWEATATLPSGQVENLEAFTPDERAAAVYEAGAEHCPRIQTAMSVALSDGFGHFFEEEQLTLAVNLYDDPDVALTGQADVTPKSDSFESGSLAITMDWDGSISGYISLSYPPEHTRDGWRTAEVENYPLTEWTHEDALDEDAGTGDAGAD